MPEHLAASAQLADLSVPSVDLAAVEAARRRQAALTKPPSSLGLLEDLSIRLAGMTGRPDPPLADAVVFTLAGDHGVAAEGVSAYPQAVTGQMLATFASGRGAVSTLAGAVGADLVLVDAGVAGGSEGIDCVRLGLAPSRDLSVQAALEVAEVALAVDAGRDLAARAAADGITVLAGGEMGIANTTPATCLAAVLTGRAVADLVGPGTGLDDAGVARKRAVCERALALHADAARGPLHALRRLGGGEIAVLCGLALGAGEHGLGYVCDGLIATAAAAVAAGIEPDLRPRLLAGHRSPEPAHSALLDHLGLEPVLDLGLRLGEGSGATAALAVLRLALAAHDGMATFAEAGVSGAGRQGAVDRPSRAARS
jgi:nicotinate-nucleotide--dimethylbenzimidazole phosphoribosyltransferase